MWTSEAVFVFASFQGNWYWQTQDPLGYQNWKNHPTTVQQLMAFSFGEGYHNTKLKWMRDFKPKRNVQTCSALILTNLADVHFVEVHCYERMLYDLICEHFSDTKHRNISFQENMQFCPRGDLLINEDCLVFDWMSSARCAEERKSLQHDHYQSMLNIYKLLPTFNATSSIHYPPLFSFNCNSYYQILPSLNTLEVQHHFSNLAQGINLKKTKSVNFQRRMNLNVPAHLFQCPTQRYISASFVCDGQSDCSETLSFDEYQCSYKHIFAENVSYEGIITRCLPPLYKSATGRCIPLLSPCLESKSKQVSNDTYRSKLEEEPTVTNHSQMDVSNERFNSQQSICNIPYQLSCGDSCRECHNFSEICVYQLSKDGGLKPCSGGEHLADCSKFECNMIFKCPQFYCVMWLYVCDGKWDCPHGNDEFTLSECSVFKVCADKFKCKFTDICIHLGQVCDQQNDCPMRDDEYLCAVAGISCPEFCTCLAYAVMCKNITLTNELLQKLFTFSFVSIYHANNVYRQTNRKQSDTTLMILTIRHAKIADLCSLVAFKSTLLLIDFIFNAIHNLHCTCFSQSQNLLNLQLSSNMLSKLSPNILTNAKKLVLLNISANPLIEISAEAFQNLLNLRILSLSSTKAFEEIELGNILPTKQSLFDFQVLQTDDHHFCCSFSEDTLCTVPLPWHLPCSRLISGSGLKIVFYIILTKVLAGNIVSFFVLTFVSKTTFHRQNAYTITTGAVCVIDTLSSVPLLILSVADHIYGDKFGFQEKAWRSSFYCALAFALFVFTYFLSPAILSFVALQRHQIVCNPIKTKFKFSSFVLVHLAGVSGLMFAFNFVMVLVTWVNLEQIGQHIPTSFCSPLVDPLSQVLAIKCLLWFTTFWQLFSALFITIIHIKLYFELEASRKKVEFLSMQIKSDVALISQLIAVTLSTLFCWIPSSVIYVVAMVAQSYPIEMVLWATLIISPLNSLLNPVIFLTVTLRRIVAH